MVLLAYIIIIVIIIGVAVMAGRDYNTPNDRKSMTISTQQTLV
jgi:uncharacterized membrane protein YvbJ